MQSTSVLLDYTYFIGMYTKGNIYCMSGVSWVGTNSYLGYRKRRKYNGKRRGKRDGQQKREGSTDPVGHVGLISFISLMLNNNP